MELIVAGCLERVRRWTTSTSWPPCRCWPTAPSTGTSWASRHDAEGAWSQLAAGSAAAARRATVLALTLPHTMQLRLSFEHGAILDGLPGWREIFALRRPNAWRPCRTPRPAVGSTPAHSRTRRAYCGTWHCGSASSSTRPSPRRTPARRAEAWGKYAPARRGALRCPARRRRGRWPAHGPPAAHPRVRGGLADAARKSRGAGRSSVGPMPARTSTPCAAPSIPRPCWATGYGARPV